MKAIKFCFLILAMVVTATAFTQDLDKATVDKLVNSKSFVFKAQTALPIGMTARQLTGSDYDVRLWADSIVTYLPYFGRSYSASYGDDGGIKINSTNFKYKAKKRRKGGWEVTITPNNAKNVRELNFTISENGSAYLQVTSNSRQSISFNGYIVERK